MVLDLEGCYCVYALGVGSAVVAGRWCLLLVVEASDHVGWVEGRSLGVAVRWRQVGDIEGTSGRVAWGCRMSKLGG